jgi:mitochondrial fission protein ELM1
VVVTIDSISMISEAIATAAPVMLAELPGSSRRSGLFLKELLDAGRVRHFVGRMDWWPVTPMDDTPRAGFEVRRWLQL